jgi:hypothetical protein
MSDIEEEASRVHCYRLDLKQRVSAGAKKYRSMAPPKKVSQFI